MAAWPDLEELKLVLNIENDDWDDTLTRVLAAAITKVKGDVKGSTGAWDDMTDEPTDNQAQAALRLAELLSERPESINGPKTLQSLGFDPTYLTLMAGQHKAFSIA